ncbi:MAG: hypothetical protein ICV55_10620 [Coleofasciculus sp. C3-bin4]|nr:hypothetical protein [Coleofasciculus sp. C3-bin4]
MSIKKRHYNAVDRDAGMSKTVNERALNSCFGVRYIGNSPLGMVLELVGIT